MRKELRVRKSQEYQKILSERKFYVSPSFTLYVKKRSLDHARIGLSVGKKLGKAVQRNKIKRQVRMMLQEVMTFDENFDGILLVRPHFLEESYTSNKKALEMLIKKVKI